MRTNSFLVFILTFLFIQVAHSQIGIPNSSPINETFNSMGATLNLPTNWKMHASTSSPTWAGGATTVTQQASTGAPTAGGTYNWGENGATDRAVGAMTSGTFASPNNLLVWMRNTNSNNLTQLSVTYTGERYRVNTAAASVQFYYSLNGTSWTAVTAGDIAASSFPTGASAYTFASPLKVTVATFNITGLNIIQNGDIYLRWNVNTTGASSQGIGIDDITITGTHASSCTPPSTQASNFSATNITATTMDVNWTSGSDVNTLVVARQGSAVNADPSNGIDYTANSAFGSGQEIGTGNFVVYKGTSTTAPVTNLISNTTYHYAIYSYEPTNKCYNLTELTGNATTLSSPPIITHTGTATVAANIQQGSTNNVLYSIKVDVTTTTTTLNTLVVTPGGTFVSGDVANFKLWFSTDNTFGGDTQIGILGMPSNGSDLTFSGLTQAFPIGTRYLFLTCDISSTATVGNTVSIKTDADADFTYSNSPTFSGSVFAAPNLMTITGIPVLKLEYPVGTDVMCGFTLPFGSIDVGMESNLTFRIKNTGTGNLNLTNLPLIISGANANQFSIFTQPTSTIAPGGFSDVVVKFIPTSNGSKTASITINSNDPANATCTVNLTGTGVSPEIHLVQTTNKVCGFTHNYGTINVGSNATVTVTIQNLGSSNLNITNLPLTLSGANADQFNISVQPTSPVAPAGSTTVTIQFIPTSGGVKNASLSIANNDPDENPCGINLTGTGFVASYFRSIASGNFSSASTWETSTDNMTWVPATVPPSAADLDVTVRAPDNVTINAATSLDQTVIQAGSTLEIINATLTIANGAGNDLIIEGILKNTLGTITTTGTIEVKSGGKYQHNYTSGAGTIPTCIWSTGSTCEVIATNNGINGLNQMFHHFIWNYPAQGAAINLTGQLTTVKGDLTIQHTNAEQLRIVASSGSGNLTVDGNFTMQNGSKLGMSSGSTPGNLILKGNVDICASCSIIDGGGTGSITFAGATQQTIDAHGATMTGPIPVTLNNPNGAVLLSDFKISNNLILTSGQFRTGDNTLDMINNSTTITSSSTNFVCTCNAAGTTPSSAGGLKRRVPASATTLFPVGPLASEYMPASLITQSTHVTDGFTVRVEPLGSSGVSHPNPNNAIQYQWILNETVAGGSSAKVKVQWTATTIGANFDPTQTPEIARWNGTGFSPISAATYNAGDPSYTSTTNFTSFSPFVANSQQSLPVELISFTAQFEKQHIVLHWITASEKENVEFQIEKSNDGIHFRKIGAVPGAGTSHDLHPYLYVDHQPQVGDNYYRLTQVDISGHVTYSQVVQVKYDNNHVPYILNPVRDQLHIQGVGQEEILQIEIISNTGTSFQLDARGSTMDLRQILPGIYTVLISTIDGTVIQRMVKL